MARLHQDFKEFLKSFNDEGVRYLLIGGYAISQYGYPRATADLDVWIAVAPDNAARCVEALKRFGMSVPELTSDLFLAKNQIVRMGVPPVRIEIHTGISGVAFEDCYTRHQSVALDGIEVTMIGLDDLKANKRASGRPRDLDDLENLPD